ncbi:histidine kinase [Dokdonia sinensis]|uniref:histidine kinase n=1 Tax=Dokdonia sinensis TaxID=2479847 RepID=A0A3M0GET6_9FLAO|nr:PAS domain-containing sensor histidine kinase [Dokdonia sinensis]RMB63250.1 histidine kinase [Dokdonia sinensis]
MDNFYYEEISNLTEAGGWMVDFLNKRSFFDDQAKRILKVPEDFIPTLKNGYKFYAEEHTDKATALFFGCAQGIPFDTKIKMVTYDGSVFWARAHGKPMENEEGEIIGIRGVFQSIDEEEKIKLQLQASLDLIEKHNERLYTFSHIVSHNLRSHVSNMQLTTQLFEAKNLSQEQQELFGNFTQIAQNLDTTLKHLNEVITIQMAGDTDREFVHIEDIFNTVRTSIKQLIVQSDAEIYTDFSEVEKVQYVPAYLESILLNLLTNSIKYRKAGVRPEIRVFTFEENEKQYLVVQDNGIGIDLKSHGDKMFQLYQTFNNNDDAVGMGLFLTRNQVEALGGKISVESTLGRGTKFTIRL